VLVRWDGGYDARVWEHNRTLILWHPGAAHTVQLFWDASTGDFVGWYINLEAPWTRKPGGFDTWEQLLDVVVSPDLSDWRVKDEEELRWAVDRGEIAQAEAETIFAEAQRAIDGLRRRAPPWNEPWPTWRPDPRWSRPTLPDRASALAPDSGG
jgi:predicted RNA-binding protein associated with RNAse of E/G family